MVIFFARRAPRRLILPRRPATTRDRGVLTVARADRGVDRHATTRASTLDATSTRRRRDAMRAALEARGDARARRTRDARRDDDSDADDVVAVGRRARRRRPTPRVDGERDGSRTRRDDDGRRGARREEAREDARSARARARGAMDAWTRDALGRGGDATRRRGDAVARRSWTTRSALEGASEDGEARVRARGARGVRAGGGGEGAGGTRRRRGRRGGRRRRVRGARGARVRRGVGRGRARARTTTRGISRTCVAV